MGKMLRREAACVHFRSSRRHQKKKNPTAVMYQWKSLQFTLLCLVPQFAERQIKLPQKSRSYRFWVLVVEGSSFHSWIHRCVTINSISSLQVRLHEGQIYRQGPHQCVSGSLSSLNPNHGNLNILADLFQVMICFLLFSLSTEGSFYITFSSEVSKKSFWYD